MQRGERAPRGFRTCARNVGIKKAYLNQPEVAIRVSLGLGNARATVWGCDLTDEYVAINGKYTT